MAQLCLELFVPELGNTVIVNPHLALLPSASVAVYKILCFPALKGEYPSYTFLCMKIEDAFIGQPQRQKLGSRLAFSRAVLYMRLHTGFTSVTIVCQN